MIKIRFNREEVLLLENLDIPSSGKTIKNPYSNKDIFLEPGAAALYDLAKDAKSKGDTKKFYKIFNIFRKHWSSKYKEFMNDFEFDLVTVYSNKSKTPSPNYLEIVHNCQFCGKPIEYVVVINCKSKYSPNFSVFKQVCVDCIKNFLGDTWKHYGQMKTILSKLKNEAIMQARKEKYAEIYHDIIMDMYRLGYHKEPEHRWTRQLYDILTTGSKTIKPEWIETIKKAIERDYKRRKLHPNDY